VLRGQIIDGLSPTILLVGCQRELISLFGLFLILLVKVPVPLGLWIIAILVDFEFIELMGLIESIIIFPVDVEV